MLTYMLMYNPRTIKSLEFYCQLCEIENDLLNLFNKLNDSEYIKGIVNVTYRKIQDFQVVSRDCGVFYELGQYDLLYTYGAIAQAGYNPACVGNIQGTPDNQMPLLVGQYDLF